jgi:hypothetical protein
MTTGTIMPMMRGTGLKDEFIPDSSVDSLEVTTTHDPLPKVSQSFCW